VGAILNCKLHEVFQIKQLRVNIRFKFFIYPLIFENGTAKGSMPILRISTQGQKIREI